MSFVRFSLDKAVAELCICPVYAMLSAEEEAGFLTIYCYVLSNSCIDRLHKVNAGRNSCSQFYVNFYPSYWFVF